MRTDDEACLEVEVVGRQRGEILEVELGEELAPSARPSRQSNTGV